MATDPTSPDESGAERPRIQVNDRRAFTRDGERREDPAVEPEPPPPGPAGAEPAASRPAEAAGETEPPPSIDFVAFVQSLYLSALMSLGEVQNPYTGQLETNLDLARQNIDILAMLLEKTRGNLDQEEQGLIDQVVPHLQLLYVKKAG